MIEGAMAFLVTLDGAVVVVGGVVVVVVVVFLTYGTFLADWSSNDNYSSSRSLQ